MSPFRENYLRSYNENNDSVCEKTFAKITKIEKGTYLEMFAKTKMLAGFEDLRENFATTEMSRNFVKIREYSRNLAFLYNPTCFH
jgi:hypothetical protein